jgi:hypothetical protein
VDILNPVNKTKASYSWRLNSKTFDLEEQMAFDTVVFLSHLVEPNQKSFITQTYLGNLGAPIQTDLLFLNAILTIPSCFQEAIVFIYIKQFLVNSIM